MFQSLLPNQKLYILHKIGIPRLEEGVVQNVSPVKTMPAAQFGQMPTQTVDVTVMVGGQTFPYSLPAQAVVGNLRDNGGITVSMSKEAMSNEILNLKQQSVDVLNSMDFHNSVIATCDSLWQQLNPEAMEKEKEKQRIDALENSVNRIDSNMAKLMELVSKSFESSERNAKTSKTKENA